MTGRPTKYKPEYCENMIAFFSRDLTEIKDKEVKATDLPLFQGYAAHLGVCMDTLTEWKSKHPEFSSAYKKCKTLQANHLVTNGLQDRYSNSFAIFTAKNVLGWRDKQEHIHGVAKSVEQLINEAKASK